jgi:hypothetical protein
MIGRGAAHGEVDEAGGDARGRNGSSKDHPETIEGSYVDLVGLRECSLCLTLGFRKMVRLLSSLQQPVPLAIPSDALTSIANTATVLPSKRNNTLKAEKA